MIIAPAVCFGLVTVFIVGCLITYPLVVVIEYIYNRGASSKVGYGKEDDFWMITLVGGGVAVVLVGVLWYVHPEWGSIIWIILTGLGFVFCFLAPIFIYFLFNDQPTITKLPHSQQGSYQSSANTKVPSSQQGFYQSSANTKKPPVHEQPNRSPGSTTISHTQEDPYRALMAKARYDQNLADRLIEDERKRLPNANLDTICRSIIERLERDNR